LSRTSMSNRTASILAKRFGVSATYIKHARTLHKRDRKAFFDVWIGKEKILAAVAPYESKKGHKNPRQFRPSQQAPKVIANGPAWTFEVDDQIARLVLHYRDWITSSATQEPDRPFEAWIETSLNADPHMEAVIKDIKTMQERHDQREAA